MICLLFYSSSSNHHNQKLIFSSYLNPYSITPIHPTSTPNENLAIPRLFKTLTIQLRSPNNQVINNLSPPLPENGRSNTRVIGVKDQFSEIYCRLDSPDWVRRQGQGEGFGGVGGGVSRVLWQF